MKHASIQITLIPYHFIPVTKKMLHFVSSFWNKKFWHF